MMILRSQTRSLDWNLMRSLSIKSQLALSFALLLGMTLLVGLMAQHSLNSINSQLSAYVHGIQERGVLAVDLLAQANRRAIAVREMVLVSTDVERGAARDQAVRANQELQTSLKRLQDAVAHAPDRERSLVDRLAEIESGYEPVALRIVELAGNGDRAAAIDKMDTECRPRLRQLLSAARDYLDYTRGTGVEAVSSAEDTYRSQRRSMAALSLLACLMAIGLGALMVRRLMGALGTEPITLSRIAQRIARGDLSPVWGAAKASERSVLRSMESMQTQLSLLIGQVRAAVDSIAAATTQIAEGSTDLAGRTETQAAAIEQTASAMAQLRGAVEHTAGNARNANLHAQQARDVAIQGGQIVDRVVETMNGITQSSRQISEIIAVIDGIAFQTNLLALNAAVEAARAGEHGRGFAVVASEVRALAGRSAAAAQQIKQLIGESVHRVEAGSTLVHEAGVNMAEMIKTIQLVTDLMSDISAVTSQQSASVAEVSQVAGEMGRTTQHNGALAEKSAAAAVELKLQSQHLVDAIGVFRLESDHTAQSAAPVAAAWELEEPESFRSVA
jgi:methyl-accepting chemotaxis protein